MSADASGTPALGGVAVRGAFATLGGQLLRFALQAGLIIVLSRLLTAADFGVYAMVVGMAAVAAVITDMGLSLAAMQDQQLSNGQRSNLFWINTGLGLILATAVFALSGQIASFYGLDDFHEVVQAMSMTFLLGGITTQYRAELSSRLQFGRLASVEVVAQVVSAGAALSLAVLGSGYWALVVQQLTASLAILVGLTFSSRWIPARPSKNSSVRKQLTYGRNAALTQLLNALSVNIPVILLGRVWGASELGMYNRAYTLVMLPFTQITSPLTRVALPVLSRAARSGAEFNAYAVRAQILVCVALLGVLTVMAAGAEPLVSILLGPEFRDTVPILQVLCLGCAFQAMGYVGYWVYLARARMDVPLVLEALGRAIMVGACALGLPWAGTGVAAGVAVGLLAIWLLNTFVGLKRVSVDVRGVVKGTVVPVLWYLGLFLWLRLIYMLKADDFGDWQGLGALAICAFVYGLASLAAQPVRSLFLQILSVVRTRDASPDQRGG